MPNEEENFMYCFGDLLKSCNEEESIHITKLCNNKMYKKMLNKYFKESNTPPLKLINIKDLNTFIEYL